MGQRWPSRRLPDDEAFEVVVVGGGINGVAIARECAVAGRRTLLIERNDFASGTTSRSTRVIHGGLRYLEHGDIGLVRESLRERERLLANRPHLVRPLDFLLALQPGGKRNALLVRTGLWLYRQLGAKHPRPENFARGICELERMLDAGHRMAFFHYEDAQCEFPERLVAEWLVEAMAAGAVACNHVEMLEVTRSRGRVSGVRLRDRFSGAESKIYTSRVINATGPWADEACERSRIATKSPMVGGVRGTHLVLPAIAGAPRAAVYAEAQDGRPVFLVPWNGQLLVGTTEVRSEAPDSDPSLEEIQYLFEALQSVLSRANFSWGDIRCAFAGVRPLPYAPGANPSSITRRHILYDHGEDGAAGMISVIGGKLTTAAHLARECARKIGIDIIEPAAPVGIAPESEIEATFAAWAHQVARVAHITEASARSMAEWNGRRAMCVARLAATDESLRAPLCPHTSHIVAEAVQAVSIERAVTLADILLRRVPVALGACWDRGCSEYAGLRIGAALGWSERQAAESVEDFERERATFLRKPQPMQVRLSA